MSNSTFTLHSYEFNAPASLADIIKQKPETCKSLRIEDIIRLLKFTSDKMGHTCLNEEVIDDTARQIFGHFQETGWESIRLATIKRLVLRDDISAAI